MGKFDMQIGLVVVSTTVFGSRRDEFARQQNQPLGDCKWLRSAGTKQTIAHTARRQKKQNGKPRLNVCLGIITSWHTQKIMLHHHTPTSTTCTTQQHNHSRLRPSGSSRIFAFRPRNVSRRLLRIVPGHENVCYANAAPASEYVYSLLTECCAARSARHIKRFRWNTSPRSFSKLDLIYLILPFNRAKLTLLLWSWAAAMHMCGMCNLCWLNCVVCVKDANNSWPYAVYLIQINHSLRPQFFVDQTFGAENLVHR